MVASNDLNISQAGYVVFDGTSTFTGRTFQAGTGITLSNASGVAGNTTINATATGTITSVTTSNATPQFVLTGTVENVNFAQTNLLLGDPGSSITSAASNVGYGIGALTGLSLGSFNAAFGTTALNACTSGVFNTACGANSASSITSGQFTTAIGYAALNAATQSEQTAVGAGALQFLTTATQNCAVGYKALQNSNSNNNSALGHTSLGLLTTGTGGNTAIGSQTATALLTGTMNVFLGYHAGQNYTGSESSNILILNHGTAAESNVIRIGAQGSGASQQNECFIAGITGATPTSGNTPQVVLVDNAGQLTPISSNTAGFVLTSNGTATPSFQAAGGGGSPVAFSAFVSSNTAGFTGAGNVQTIPYNTVSFDTNSGFNTSTATYTFPVAGIYQLNILTFAFVASGVNTSTQILITASINAGATTFRVCDQNAGNLGLTVNSEFALTNSIMYQAALNDTIIITVQVLGGTNNIGIAGGSFASQFSGFKIG